MRGKWLVLLPFFLSAALSLSSPGLGSSFPFRRGRLSAGQPVLWVRGRLCLGDWDASFVDAGGRQAIPVSASDQADGPIRLSPPGTTIQVVFPHVHTTWTCITMGLALHYGLLCEFHGALDALTACTTANPTKANFSA
jgi:hypothetical protein